jgi:hypothetical protein
MTLPSGVFAYTLTFSLLCEIVRASLRVTVVNGLLGFFSSKRIPQLNEYP